MRVLSATSPAAICLDYISTEVMTDENEKTVNLNELDLDVDADDEDEEEDKDSG